jgi:hypothetical protein
VPSLTLAEVPFAAPLAPAAGLGAGALITLLAWLICFTLAYIWRRSFGAMLQWLADEIDRVRLPHVLGGGHVLGPVSAAFRFVDTRIEGSLDYAANHTEHAAVWLFNHAAARFDQLGREIGGLAFDVAVWGHNLVHGTIPRELAAAQRVTVARLDALRARVPALVHGAVAPLRATVNRLTVAVEHEFDVLGRRIGRVGSRVGRLEHTVEGELGRLSRVEKLLGVAAFTALVGAALGRLGLRWLRCGNVRKTGQRLCGMDAGLLESLLADALLVGGAISLVELAEHMQGVVGESAGLIQRFWRAA